MKHNNASGADNQQERLKTIGWIVGFVDGEGCFSVSIFRNATAKTKTGWQVFSEFVVSQGESSRNSLEKIKRHFRCGYIIVNKRKDNHHEHMLKYCVRSIGDLRTKIIPFFDKHKLITRKYKDFKIFKKIVNLIYQRKHLSEKGMIKIAQLISTMNRKKRPKFLESSETIRRTLSEAERRIERKI